MKNAIILHGTLGSPDGNWFGWLKDQLEQKGLQVWLPELPNASQPSLKEWQDFVNSNCPFEIDQDTLIVGHSSGAILAVILAQQNDKPIGGVVCVSVFHDNSLNWDANSRLFDVEFDFEKAKKTAKKRLFVHSDTDPYVPVDQAKYVADNVDGEFVLIPGQGHFNLEQSPEYNAFPKLIELIKEEGLF